MSVLHFGMYNLKFSMAHEKPIRWDKKFLNITELCEEEEIIKGELVLVFYLVQ